jgi:hypothetical protein
MTHAIHHLDDAQHEAKKVVRKAGPWVERLARFGFAARGLIYLLMGALAVMEAIGWRQEAVGTRGAFQTVLDRPFGQVLLGIVAAGFLGMALWQLISAALDSENNGSDGKGIRKRLLSLWRGTIQLSLAATAIGMIFGYLHASSSNGGGENAPHWTAVLMSFPLGRWLVAGAGAGFVAGGLRQLYRSYCTKLDDQLALHQMDKTPRRWAIFLSRFGIAARGVVFLLIGVFLFLAAYNEDPHQARGIAGSLHSLRLHTHGAILLTLVGLGLAAYAFYLFLLARYRRIQAV